MPLFEGQVPKEPIDIRPYFFIPYWKDILHPGDLFDPKHQGDVGKRPLPDVENGVPIISYLCEGIHATPYTPKQPLTVTVDVGNCGDGSQAQAATVIVYWSEPVVGVFSKPEVFGVANVQVKPGEINTTPEITGTIKTEAKHICLFAVVTHDLDDPGLMDPIHNRHWAQHNLTAIEVLPNKQYFLPFAVSTPLSEKDTTFELDVRVADEPILKALSLRFKATPRNRVKSLRVQLFNDHGKPLTDFASSIKQRIKLNEHSIQGLHLALQLNEDLEPHEFIVLEIILIRISREKRELAGSIGVMMRPYIRNCEGERNLQ
ncbi:TPA: hypothetical protein QCX40_005773 [Bacillus cereus]|uniref:hypothetical protein n=1 Tax=Bacillus cereus TaxID=1396 RepID=UPI000B608D80|nr:hypothetical protein [Bacillus cereus]ASL62715.1 hypothetical protein FORC47_p363 [Bacillus cereus]HDR7495028.1 hypothetical protein [Bacillus cereus]